MVIRKGRLMSFGILIEGYKDNADWTRHCLMMELEGIRQRGHLKKMWWSGVQEDVKRSVHGGCMGLEQVEGEHWGEGGGQPANPGHLDHG